MVSEHLDGFAELRAHLATWRALEPPAPPGRVRSKALLWSGTLLGAWLATGFVRNIALASVAGIVVLVMGSLTLKTILANKTVSNRQKASAVLSMGMFMMAPVARWVLHFWFNIAGGLPS